VCCPYPADVGAYGLFAYLTGETFSEGTVVSRNIVSINACSLHVIEHTFGTHAVTGCYAFIMHFPLNVSLTVCNK